MSTITAVLEAGDEEKIINFCEEGELSSAVKGEAHPYAAVHLICLLLQEDLCEARFLWKRLPQSEKEKEDIATTWRATQALWRSDFPSFYTAMTSHVWSTQLQPLVDKLLADTRKSAVKLISNAFSVITVDRAVGLVGLDRSGLAAMCSELGWRLENDCVLPTASTGDSGVKDGAAGSIAELQTLTEQLLRLQTAS